MNRRIIFKVKKEESKIVKTAWFVCEMVCLFLAVITNLLGTFIVGLTGEIGIYLSSILCFVMYLLVHEIRREM